MIHFFALAAGLGGLSIKSVAIAALVLGGLTALGMALATSPGFLQSDRFREMYAWGLVDGNGNLTSVVGNTSSRGRAVARLDEQFTIAGVGNAADLTDDLAYSTVLKPKTLGNNNDELVVEAQLLSAANGNNKTAKIILGATTLLTTGVLTSNAKNIKLRLKIVRTAAATQLWFAEVTVDGVATTLTKGTSAEDLTTQLTLKLTLASPTTGAASDLLAFAYSVDVAGAIAA